MRLFHHLADFFCNTRQKRYHPNQQKGTFLSLSDCIKMRCVLSHVIKPSSIPSIVPDYYCKSKERGLRIRGSGYGWSVPHSLLIHLLDLTTYFSYLTLFAWVLKHHMWRYTCTPNKSSLEGRGGEGVGGGGGGRFPGFFPWIWGMFVRVRGRKMCQSTTPTPTMAKPD